VTDGHFFSSLTLLGIEPGSQVKNPAYFAQAAPAVQNRTAAP